MQGMLVIPSFRGGAGFSGPAHSVEQEIGCTADSCRAQHVGWCPQTPTMENGKLGMGNSLCLFGDPAGVVLSWFSAGSQDCEKTKNAFELEPNHYRDGISDGMCDFFPFGSLKQIDYPPTKCIHTPTHWFPYSNASLTGEVAGVSKCSQSL